MALSLIFDIVLAVLCLIIIIRNAARGFVKSFMVLAKTVLAALIAYIFCTPLAKVLSNWIFSSLSQGWVKDLMLSTVKGQDGYALYEIFDGIPNWFTKATVSAGVDEELVDFYFVNENLASLDVVNNLSVSLGDALSMLISAIISFILIFIVIEIILAFLSKLLDKVSDLPVLKAVNIILGALIGAVISAVIAWLISAAIVWVFEFGGSYYPHIFDMKIIERTVIVEFFDKHNLFEIVRGWFA